MQVSIETTSGLERRLTVGVPSVQVESEVAKRLKDASKNVRINGFRQGKVPMKVIKQRYGAGVRQEVIGEVMSRSFYEAVQKEDVKPAGQPSIEAKEIAEGKDLEYVATFEVYPSIELADLTKIEVTKHNASVSDTDVGNMIEVLRKQQATWSEVERAAAIGDKTTIDFVGTKDGEEFAGSKAEAHELLLGSGSMIPGFEDGVVGLKAGEEKTLSLTFPDDYKAEELKGAAVEFTVKLIKVLESELPELNDELYVKFGVEEGGEAKFREEVKGNMDRELANAAKAKVKKQVMDSLIEANPVDLPSPLVANEINTLRNQMMQQFGGASDKIDGKALLPDDMFKEEAGRRVALGLLVGEVINTAKLKADGDKVRAMVEEVASTYQSPEEVVEYYYSNEQMLQGVEAAVLEDQVVEHVMAAAKITEQESSYDDLIKPQTA
jgi:trigger factor